MEDDKRSVDKKTFFDYPKNVKRLLHFFYGSCALLLILDFVIHRHAIYRWENLWGFYPIFGFVSCVILVLVATRLRTFLMRAEDYYDFEEKDPKEKGADEQHNGNVAGKNSTAIGKHNVDD